MIRFGQIGKLKLDKIEGYRALHAQPWPDVLKTITDCNLRNYSIFRHGDIVLAYFEYVAEDPVTQEWWKHTKPRFEKYAMDGASGFCHDMQSICYHP